MSATALSASVGMNIALSVTLLGWDAQAKAPAMAASSDPGGGAAGAYVALPRA